MLRPSSPICGSAPTSTSRRSRRSARDEPRPRSLTPSARRRLRRVDGHAGVLPSSRDGGAGRARRAVRAPRSSFDGPELEIARDWIDEGVEHATADFDRFYARGPPGRSPSRRCATTISGSRTRPRARATARALHDLPEGTLGHAYIEFYRRNDITVPGADMHTPAHYVSHDMNHVISGLRAHRPRRDRARCVHARDERQRRELDAVHRQPRRSTRPGCSARRDHAEGRHADPAGRDRPARRSAVARRTVHVRLQPGRSPLDGDWPLDEVRAHFGVPGPPTRPG